MFKLISVCLLLFSVLLCVPKMANSATSQLVEVDDHSLHAATWGEINDLQKPWVVLISGPIDSWHSDTAWFAALAPELAKSFRVVAVDRAGLVTNTTDAPVGYLHFADDLRQLLDKMDIRDATLIAFASANLTANRLLQEQGTQRRVSRVMLIDPDVLTDYSIARYSADAKPFKDNLDAYQAYIQQGKYTARVKQKNQADLELLTELNKSSTTDWQYVDAMMNARLQLHNQTNLFNEIALYQDELEIAAALTWPDSIPTFIIDTQFEQAYLKNAKDEKARQGLLAWQQDAKSYYQKLAALSPANRYLEVETSAHLFQFEQPERVVQLIKELQREGAP